MPWTPRLGMPPTCVLAHRASNGSRPGTMCRGGRRRTPGMHPLDPKFMRAPWFFGEPADGCEASGFMGECDLACDCRERREEAGHDHGLCPDKNWNPETRETRQGLGLSGPKPRCGSLGHSSGSWIPPKARLDRGGGKESKMAERGGFEPPVVFSYSRFPGVRLKPLSHLSAQQRNHARRGARGANAFLVPRRFRWLARGPCRVPRHQAKDVPCHVSRCEAPMKRRRLMETTRYMEGCAPRAGRVPSRGGWTGAILRGGMWVPSSTLRRPATRASFGNNFPCTATSRCLPSPA